MKAAPDDTRDRILRAAARLLAEAGGEPVSTRAICTAAGVGAPTLYHHFGDKEGLLDAVASRGFEEYLAEKRAQRPTGDPVEDLRRGWDLHVEFGLTHPVIYVLMYGSARTPAAAKEAHDILVGLLENVARAGRLRVPVETAARMVHAAGAGVTLSLIADPAAAEADGHRGPAAARGGLSARTREAVLAAITGPAESDIDDDPSGDLSVAQDDLLGDDDLERSATPPRPVAPRRVAGRRPEALDARHAGPSGHPVGRDAESVGRRAIALRAALDAEGGAPLTATEVALLRDWLDRLGG